MWRWSEEKETQISRPDQRIQIRWAITQSTIPTDLDCPQRSSTCLVSWVPRGVQILFQRASRFCCYGGLFTQVQQHATPQRVLLGHVTVRRTRWRRLPYRHRINLDIKDGGAMFKPTVLQWHSLPHPSIIVAQNTKTGQDSRLERAELRSNTKEFSRRDPSGHCLCNKF